MSRPLRIEYPGAWYHVMNWGRRREQIFRTSRDYEVFIEVLQETAELRNLQVAGYCLMPNHYHLLLHTPEGNISSCMRHINSLYTQRFNRTHKEDGQLFRGRYKAVVVSNDSNLLEVLRYIHRNPIRAELVQDAGDFLWSSHRGYISRAKKWDWLSTSFLLAKFSQNDSQARKVYSDFISGQESEKILKFYARKNLPSILGDEEFKDLIKERFKELRFNKEIPESRSLALNSAGIRDIVCQVYEIDEQALLQSRRGKVNQARDLAIFLQRKYCGQTLSELGKDYGIASYSTVSSACDRVKTRLQSDSTLQAIVTKIEKKLE